MKLGKRERAERRERLAAEAAVRMRGDLAMADYPVKTSLRSLWPAQTAKPRIKSFWTSSSARSIAARDTLARKAK